MSKVVTLEVLGPVFYSYGDEKSFFSRLEELPCILSIQGEVRTLYIDVQLVDIDVEDVREIVSTFRRFKVKLSEISKLETPETTDFLRNRKSVLYKMIYG